MEKQIKDYQLNEIKNRTVVHADHARLVIESEKNDTAFFKTIASSGLTQLSFDHYDEFLSTGIAKEITYKTVNTFERKRGDYKTASGKGIVSHLSYEEFDKALAEFKAQKMKEKKEAAAKRNTEKMSEERYNELSAGLIG